MYIKRLSINNFRGIKEGTFDFGSGMNILIGPSNSRKTTVLKAIDLVLNPNYLWWRRDVLDTFDFFMEDTKTPLIIRMRLGCGERECVGDSHQCPRFECSDGEDTQTCKLTDCLIFVDNATGKVVKTDDIKAQDWIEANSATEGVVKADHVKEGDKIEACLDVEMMAIYRKEGYAEVTHRVLDENSETRCDFTRRMKEWIGIVALEAGRNPDSECCMQYNSMLSRCLGEVGEWQKGFVDAFRTQLRGKIDEFVANDAKDFLKGLVKTMEPVGPVMNGIPAMTIAGAAKRDLLRQVQLCMKHEKLELPIARHGRGTQNVMALLLAALSRATPRELRPKPSIILIEEPEQNLEPGMQRSVISFIRDSLLGVGESRQCIVATHSPFVLTSPPDLKQVHRLCVGTAGTVTCRNLGAVCSKTFPHIRILVPFENELFESLFGDLIVIWEGECEAGLYQAMMRHQKDCPAELLTGIIAGGAQNLPQIAKWFQDAGYTPVVVCDGDAESEQAMRELETEKSSFIALPRGQMLEDCIADLLASLPNQQSIKVLLSVMGAQGAIYKGGTDAANIKKWAALDTVFTQMQAKHLDAGQVIAAMTEAQLPDRSTVVDILKNHKKRYVHRIIGELLSQIDCFGPFQNVIDKLKEGWSDKGNLGRFQMQRCGTLVPYELPKA